MCDLWAGNDGGLQFKPIAFPISCQRQQLLHASVGVGQDLLDEIVAGHFGHGRNLNNAEPEVQGGQIDEISSELSGNVSRGPLLNDVRRVLRAVSEMHRGK